MTDSMEWLRVFIIHYPSLQYIIIFVGTALIGELALFVLGFLVATNILPVFSVILFGFLGSFVPNIFWYFLGKTNAVHKLASYRHTNATFSAITDGVRRVSRGNHLIALVIIKFLVGTPVLLTMYANRTFLKGKE